jgi:hypothetical protein
MGRGVGGVRRSIRYERKSSSCSFRWGRSVEKSVDVVLRD